MFCVNCIEKVDFHFGDCVHEIPLRFQVLDDHRAALLILEVGDIGPDFHAFDRQVIARLEFEAGDLTGALEKTELGGPLELCHAHAILAAGVTRPAGRAYLPDRRRVIETCHA